MSLLRRVRAEWSGALRSVRYDLGRRPVEPPSRGPDMTSTGMNTFGGLLAEEPAGTPKIRGPRRAALITALGVLTVVGAAGAYLGVVNGLGSFLNAAQAGTVPSQPGTTFSPNSGIGRGPTKAKSPIRPDDLPPAPITTPTLADPAAGAITKAAAKAAARNASPLRTTSPAKGECHCGSLPPVPTPTVPQSEPVPSDSASPSTSADPSPSETSATPGYSAEPTDSPQARHRRWPH